MVNFVRVYRNNEHTLLPLREYLLEYHSDLPEGWDRISRWIVRVFDIRTESEYQVLARELQVEDFDVFKIKEAYIKLRDDYSYFDNDILRFFAFLSGTTYFPKIGNPTFDQWLNSIDINQPFKERESLDYGFSFIDASKYSLGQNSIRKSLLSTLRWISSQGGS